MKILLTKPEIQRILRRHLEKQNPDYVVEDDKTDGWLRDHTYELWFTDKATRILIGDD